MLFRRSFGACLDLFSEKGYNNTIISNTVIGDIYFYLSYRKGVFIISVKDHSLDHKIIDAARQEFLACGYSKASLHKIADRAGITTGALYTRYKNKDALFSSLIASVFSAMEMHSEEICQLYNHALKTREIQDFLAAIRLEEAVYLDLLFEHYEACVLFFCKSMGSSAERMLTAAMQKKAEDTVGFLRTVSKKDVNLDGVELILSEQFSFYRKILEKGYTKEQASCCLETIRNFLEAGWQDLFKRIL